MLQYENEAIMALQVIIFIRLLKLMSLFSEIKELLIIMETARNMIGPVSSVFAVLLLIMYFYAFMGMRAFGGKVRIDTECLMDESCAPRPFHLMNFNDMLSSMFTLWSEIIAPFGATDTLLITVMEN